MCDLENVVEEEKKGNLKLNEVVGDDLHEFERWNCEKVGKTCCCRRKGWGCDIIHAKLINFWERRERERERWDRVLYMCVYVSIYRYKDELIQLRGFFLGHRSLALTLMVPEFSERGMVLMTKGTDSDF